MGVAPKSALTSLAPVQLQLVSAYAEPRLNDSHTSSSGNGGGFVGSRGGGGGGVSIKTGVGGSWADHSPEGFGVRFPQKLSISEGLNLPGFKSGSWGSCGILSRSLKWAGSRQGKFSEPESLIQLPSQTSNTDSYRPALASAVSCTLRQATAAKTAKVAARTSRQGAQREATGDCDTLGQCFFFCSRSRLMADFLPRVIRANLKRASVLLGSLL